MKKRSILILVIGLILVAGVAFSVIQPQSGAAPTGKDTASVKASPPATVAERIWGQARSLANRVVALKKFGRLKSPSRSGLLVIGESPVGGSADGSPAAEAVEDPAAVEAGLRALNQVSVRGIIRSNSRSSAVLNTGSQNESVFVGNEFNVKLRSGFVVLKCEKIEERSVWLRVPRTTVLAEVRLP